RAPARVGRPAWPEPPPARCVCRDPPVLRALVDVARVHPGCGAHVSWPAPAPGHVAGVFRAPASVRAGERAPAAAAQQAVLRPPPAPAPAASSTVAPEG